MDWQTLDEFMAGLVKINHPEPKSRYLKQCNRCLKVFEGQTRTELFTRHGWHLRLNHYPEWGNPRGEGQRGTNP